MNIPIVVAAYDRVAPMERLLSSLLQAQYDTPVELIISIDGGGAAAVPIAAARFAWPHGEKRVIHHEKNLGLRQHIISCGELSTRYDGIILLEDDLYVSPWFYRYAESAADYYATSNNISGIALYSPRFNESARLPFYALNDGSDVFFMQLACSWGQLWLKSQWEEFADWYADNADRELEEDTTLPFEIRHWPNSSWKKYFIKFMVERDKYFVYPRNSFTTNFGDFGSHHEGTLLYQVPLVYGNMRGFTFVNFAESFVKYDAFCEMIPESFEKICPQLRAEECVIDLYGVKESHCFTKKYVLTSKKCDNPVASYGRYLKPIECNVFENITGCYLFLVIPENICKIDKQNFREYIYTKCATSDEQKYYNYVSDVHYFIFRKEIKKYKAISEDAVQRVQELRKYKHISEDAVRKVQVLKFEIFETEKKLTHALKSVDLVRDSASYKIGNTILRPLRYLKGKLKL